MVCSTQRTMCGSCQHVIALQSMLLLASCVGGTTFWYKNTQLFDNCTVVFVCPPPLLDTDDARSWNLLLRPQQISRRCQEIFWYYLTEQITFRATVSEVGNEVIELVLLIPIRFNSKTLVRTNQHKMADEQFVSTNWIPRPEVKSFLLYRSR